MTDRQKAKHERDNAVPATKIPDLDMTGLTEPKTPPRLSWLNAKKHSGFSDRRHKPGRKTEQLDAIYDYSFVTEEKRLNDARPNLPDNQAEVPVVAAGTPQT